METEKDFHCSTWSADGGCPATCTAIGTREDMKEFISEERLARFQAPVLQVNKTRSADGGSPGCMN